MSILTQSSAAYTQTSSRPVSLIGRVFLLLGLHASRRSLARLDAAMLRDIGIDAGTARREASRPVWDVPAAWRC